MAITDEVLVIGGGLAGRMAALAAADHADSVRIVSAAPSTLEQASGLVDLLGYLPGDSQPIVDPWDAIPSLPADHPYRIVGTAAVRDAMERFEAVVGDRYRGSTTDRNALVATTAGTVKPTARYPAAMAEGLVSDDRETLLVGFAGQPDFDPHLVAAQLERAQVPFACRGRTISFPETTEPEPTPRLYARRLEDDPSVRARLVERILEGGDTERVGFPAVLGAEDPAALRADLADRLGAAVFELPGAPPSLPGRRLADQLNTALAERGVRQTTNRSVVAVEGDDRIERVQAEADGRQVPHEAAEYVLATGGLIGGGIASDREAVREPVAGCHVAQPDDRYAWFDEAPFGDHPFARFGLTVDDELRPLEPDGEPRFGNLRTAGAVLGGYDFGAEKSGSGVSIATGVVAGRRAGEVAA